MSACHPEQREGSSASDKYATSLYEEDLSLPLKMTKEREDTPACHPEQREGSSASDKYAPFSY